MFGRKKEKKNDDDMYINIEGKPFADPVTRTISDEFNDDQKGILFDALSYGYPARAVACPEISAYVMDKVLTAWGDIYVLEKYKVPGIITDMDLWKLAQIFEKGGYLWASHSDTSNLNIVYGRHTFDEDIENTMVHFLISAGYGHSLMDALPQPTQVDKNVIIALATAMRLGKDYTNEYLKTGEFPGSKIIKLCKKNDAYIPYATWFNAYNEKLSDKKRVEEIISNL